ncbi:MAG: nuclear transport factor 2 family protein [Ferruginibacter sp.]|nr:nuclear transport factor 2 family protein [Cytophagales bacterium]
MYANEELLYYLLPLNTNQAVIEQLYACFSRKDYQGMSACYHPDAEFSDGVLAVKGKQIAAMWHLLCESANDLSVECYLWNADGVQGSADWEATYTFSPTGRKVHNLFHARFDFSEGKIIRHRENFHFWRWAGMALGTTGLLLGWTPFIRNQVRKTAVANLREFADKHPQYTALFT